MSFLTTLQAGPRLTSLELSGVDELNLAAVAMVGASCRLLEHLALSCCHYMQVGSLLGPLQWCTGGPCRSRGTGHAWKPSARKKIWTHTSSPFKSCEAPCSF